MVDFKIIYCRLYQKLPELLEASPRKVKTFEDIVYIALETSKKIEEVIVQVGSNKKRSFYIFSF